MENTTKALLIAAAVLVAIIIISLTLMIVTSNADTATKGSSTLDATAIKAFNDKFTRYFSKSAPGTTAKALTQTIIQHNASINKNEFSPDDHHVYLNFYPYPRSNSTKLAHRFSPKDLQVILDKITSTRRYKINVTGCTSYDSPTPGYYNGYLICISIEELQY